MLLKHHPDSPADVFQKRPPGSGGGRWRKRALILAGVTVAFFVVGHLGGALCFMASDRKIVPLGAFNERLA